MKIVYDVPPNYDEIAAVFKIKDRLRVVFTYGNTLYVPGGTAIKIDKPLMKHEETHARQQKAYGVDDWWERFLHEPAFRLQQELEAYRTQYKNMVDLPLEDRLGYLEHISNDLAGEIYGNMLTAKEAKAVITEGIVLKHTKPGSAGITSRLLKKRQRQNRKKGRK
jgi:hypothetical protein